MRSKVIILLFVVVILTSCSNNTVELETLKTNGLETKLVTDEENISINETHIENKVYPDYVLVSPDEDSYAVAETDIGELLIKISEVTPYLNGYNVKLVIGNYNDITFSGIDLRITSGKGWNGFNDANEQIITVNDEIYENEETPRGRWKQVEITFDNVTADEIKYLRVYVDTSMIKSSN